MQNNPSTNQPFRALAIDGGGMRGFYSAALLNALSQRFGGARTDLPRFDLGARCKLICGTSTGAILACGLVANVPLPQIMRLYCKWGPEIFPRPMPKEGKTAMLRWMLRHLYRPAAEASKLRSALLEIFEEKTLAETYKERQIGLCIPTINAETYKAWVFKTPHISGKTRDNEYRLADVCMASAAAPIFFPIHKIADPQQQTHLQGFVDGGLWANNATLTALVESLEMAASNQHIHIVAVGTASRPNGDPSALESPDWGILQWKGGIEAVNMSISAQAYGHDSAALFIARALSNNGRTVKIIRLEETAKSPEKHSAIGLDRADKTAIDTMMGMANDDANNIHSDKNRDSNWYPIVRDFFSNQ